MNEAAPASRTRFVRWIAAIAIVLALLVAAIFYVAQPQRSTRMILDRVGAALGLEITASTGRLRLSGTPALVVDNLSAREPGARQPLLRADRVALSVPWATIRSGGSPLVIDHVDLDRPVVDVAALSHWLQRRPPGPTRIPTLTRGLDVRDGRVLGMGWTVETLNLHLPHLAPARRVTARFDARYRSDALQVPFALAVVSSSTTPQAALGVAGDIAIEGRDWRIPASIVLSGVLRSTGGVHLDRTRLSASARYESGKTRAPFALGIGGRFHLSPDVRLAPAAIAVRAAGLIPTLDASGAIALGKQLDVSLGGRLARWPSAWPQLPSPLDASPPPLPFQLLYHGAPDLTGVAELGMQSERADFDARFQLARMTSWINADGSGSPLPPLDGTLSAPRIDLAGAQLQGVEITLDDPDIPDTVPRSKP